MNTTTTTAAATSSLEELKGLITEFELDRRDYYYGLSDKELAFADACCSGNTIDELAKVLRYGSGHWTCAALQAQKATVRPGTWPGLSGWLASRVPWPTRFSVGWKSLSERYCRFRWG